MPFHPHVTLTHPRTTPPDQQVHLATYSVKEPALAARGHTVVADAEMARIMRSTVMKPESADAIVEIHARLEQLVR